MLVCFFAASAKPARGVRRAPAPAPRKPAVSEISPAGEEEEADGKPKSL